MPKYINADEIDYKIICYPHLDFYTGTVSTEELDGVYALKTDIDAMPAADVQEIKHGKWIPDKKREGIVICSECKRGECCDWFRYKYCYECGARMDLEDKQ